MDLGAVDLVPQQLDRQRARLLARVPSGALPAIEMIELLVFCLGTERYAVGTEHVREVLRFGDCTPLPATPDFLIGITNVRGQILAVFDPRRLFDLPALPQADRGGEHARIIVLGDERAEFGVLADVVTEVVRLRSDAVLEAPGSVAGIARAFLRGVTADALIVLDGAILLKDQRLFIQQSEDGGSRENQL